MRSEPPARVALWGLTLKGHSLYSACPMPPADLPDPLAIAPRGPLDATVTPPGSKSITNRALLVGGAGAGESVLAGVLESDDTRRDARGLRSLGVRDGRTAAKRLERAGRRRAGCVPAPAPLDARASGTTARFLTRRRHARDGPVVIDGTARMRERPIADLAAALDALGARIEVLGAGGCPPVRVRRRARRRRGALECAALEPIRLRRAARGALRASAT